MNYIKILFKDYKQILNPDPTIGPDETASETAVQGPKSSRIRIN